MSTSKSVLLSVALSAGSLLAQAVSPATEGVGQNAPIEKRPQLVTLNVVAFDSKNQPVGDLTSDDFQIQDQGKHQQIVYFRHNQTKPLKPRPPERNEYSNESGLQQATVILLDLMNANLSDRGTGWEGIDHALERLEAGGENLYLYLLTADGKLYPVRGLPGSGPENPALASGGWTKQIRATLDQAVRTVNRLKPADDQDQMIRVRMTYHVLSELATQMSAIPGRKNVVWITHGVPVIVHLISGGLVDTTDNMRKFAVALNHLGIVMYTVDQGGPGSTAPGESRGSEGPGFQSQDTLEQLSGLTGGKAYPGNNVENAIATAIASSGGSYVILYDPPPQNWDNKYHKLKVNCTRKGIHLQAQQGYYAIAQDNGMSQLKEAFDGAATRPLDSSGIGLRATVSAKPDAAQTVHYDIRIDPSNLLLTHQGDREVGQLVIAFAGITGAKMETLTPSMVNVNLTKEQMAAAEKDGIRVAEDKVLKPGTEKVRIVVMDVTSAETGSLTIPVTASASH